jgi:hypothetical protein
MMSRVIEIWRQRELVPIPPPELGRRRRARKSAEAAGRHEGLQEEMNASIPHHATMTMMKEVGPQQREALKKCSRRVSKLRPRIGIP